MRSAFVLAMLAGIGAAVGQPAPVDTGPLHFDHGKHRTRGMQIDATTCLTCHATDAKGTIMPPAATGHSPCLSVCHSVPDKKDFTHASWFIATGATTKAKNRPLFDHATQFCLGCHDGTEAPLPASKPTTAAVLRAFRSEREYHVIMKAPKPKHFGHYSHLASAGNECSFCHSVGGKTDATPDHPQCAKCHDGVATFAMSNCGTCHKAGGRAAIYPEGNRPKIDVRECGSEGHLAWATAQKLSPDQVSCFTHDRVEHRFEQVGKTKPFAVSKAPLECSHCHAVVIDDKLKLDLPRLHTQAIIPSEQIPAHKLCGSCHPHENQVDYSGHGPKQCVLCHADHSREEFN